MPGTAREAAKEDDSGINPGHLGWKINQREGCGSECELTPPSAAPHEAPSLCKPGSSCPALSWGAGQAEVEPLLLVLDRPGFKFLFCYFTY